MTSSWDVSYDAQQRLVRLKNLNMKNLKMTSMNSKLTDHGILFGKNILTVK